MCTVPACGATFYLHALRFSFPVQLAATHAEGKSTYRLFSVLKCYCVICRKRLGKVTLVSGLYDFFGAKVRGRKEEFIRQVNIPGNCLGQNILARN